MNFNKLRVSEEATKKLSQMKAKTGLRPNILCRLAFCYSLNDPVVPEPSKYTEDGMEFNKFTLLGEWEPLYMALMRERLANDGLDIEKDFMSYFKAHINRGVFAMYGRIKDIGDLGNLLQ